MIVQIILPLVLSFIMFVMGLDLSFKDFQNIYKFPKAFITGMFLQVVLLPCIAFFIASLFELPTFLTIGLIIISCCPGGVASNYLTYIIKGDTALSISLTATASMVGIFTIPFIIKLGLEKFTTTPQEFSILLASLKIFLMTTTPVALGMFVNHRFQNFTKKYKPLFTKAAAGLFGLLIIGAVLKQRAMFFEYFPQVGYSILGLNLATMLSAIIASKVLSLEKKQELALTIECGFQNVTLAMVIASTILHNNEYLITAGVYGVLMFLTAGSYLIIIKSLNRN